MRNPLLATALSLRGNPRACVYTEPLWGLSMCLCLPYASVYMLELGVHDAQLGFVTSVGMFSQVVFGLLGGVITDKLGRRVTTAVFDVVAWCVPCLIWFFASMVGASWAFGFFLGASVVNGALQVTQNSWDALMAEDASRDQITGIYSLVIVAGHLSAIFAPIAAVLVAQYSLVPAVRVLYLNAFVVMMIKIIWLYKWSHETAMGRMRMEATKGVPLTTLLAGYRGVIGLIRRSPGTIFSLVIAIIVGAVGCINATFWQVIVSRKLLVPDPLLPIFAMGRSVVAMIFLFTVVPMLTKRVRLKAPLLLGFASYAAGQILVSCIPAGVGEAGPQTYIMLVCCLLADGFGTGILAMLAESLVALHVDRQERSRVMAMQRTLIMVCVAPFGWIGGLLSATNRSLPFVLSTVVLLVGVVVTMVFYRTDRPDAAEVME